MSDFIIKQVAVAAGNAVGGTVGAGVATLAYGTAIATREFTELVQKLENGEATQADVVAAFAAAETALLGLALIGAVTVPLTIPLLVGLAGLAVAYSRNADATGDAVKAALNPPNGVGNPLDVYRAFDRRSKAIEQEKRDRKNQFPNGVNWRQPSDPLVLDLDGDGIELTAASNTVLFDHNQDNIRTGTQWVKPDDGILVRDLNGNGLIDSGRELFGDQTYLPPGFGSAFLGTGGTGSGTGTLGTGLGGPQLATNGWQALAALDSNRDGIINASDAAFAELKVWRDLNQDGISQANELQTLSQAGVSSINLGPNAAAGTQVTGSYTTTAGTTRTAQNIDFATNNFYSEFTDNPAVTATAAGLPQLQGAGFVRDMREAMSLGTAQSQTLAQTITSFKTATTTQARQALLDQVITAWANTSSLGDAKARNPLPTAALLSASNGGGWYVGSPAQAIADFAQSQPALYAQLSALERFNGQPVIERYTRATNASYYDGATGTYKGYTFYTVSIEPQRLPFFQTAYDSLKASTYQSLYLQTEGKQLLGGRRKQRDQYSNYYKNRSCLRTNLLGYSPTLYLKPRVVRAPCMDVAKQPRLTQSLIGILGSTHTDLHAMHSF